MDFREIHKERLKKCDQGRHTFRENKIGVIWCVVCGQLANNQNMKADKLKDSDRVIFKIKKDE